MPPIIEARGLTRRYGDFVAVDGIDFTVEAGEFFGLLGPNGAGKTTVIRMITCQLLLTAGTLRVDGLDVRTRDREIKAQLGIVSQDDNLDPDLSVRKNLEVYARYFDIPRAVAQGRIEEGLALMQLDGRGTESVAQLSGGLKRRLVIARALVNNPRILILDEPTTGLDPQARHLVWRKLRLLRERGTTIVLTTHYMEEAAQLCDRLVVLDRGRILEEGRPRDLVQRHAGTEVLEMHLIGAERARIQRYFDHAPRDGVRLEDVEGVLYGFGADAADARAAEEITGDPYRVVFRRANLEDVFLALTGRALTEGEGA